MAPTFLFIVLAALVHFGSAASHAASFRQVRRINIRKQNGRQTPAPFNCVKAGFYADPKDCTRFYRCVDFYGTETQFTLFEFICAEGTIFDEALSVCNHPAWVNPTPACWATTPGLNATTASAPPASSSEAAATTAPPVVTAAVETSTAAPVTESTASSSSGETVAPVEPATQPNGIIETTTAAAPVTELSASSSSGPTTSGETAAPVVTETSAPSVTEPTTSAPSSSVEPATDLPTPTTAPTVPPTTPTVPPSATSVPPTESSAEIIPTSSASEVAPTEPASAATAAPATESSSAAPQPELTTAAAPATTASSGEVSAATSASPLVQPPTTAVPFMLTCNDDIFHRHPVRCDLYYKCIWTDLAFSVDLRACPAGLHYDEASGTCKSPGRTTACTFATLPPGGIATTESLTTSAVTESTTTTVATEVASVVPTTAAPTEAPVTSAVPSTTPATEAPITSAAPSTEAATEAPVTSAVPLTTAATEAPVTSAAATTAPPAVETTATTAPSSVPAQYTLAPGSLYDCKQPGHYPYQLDCIRFYRCFEIQPSVLKGLLYRCPLDYAYSTATERCVRQNTLPACDRNGIRLPMDFPVPLIPLEDTTMVHLEDFDSFFGNPNYFYMPRRKINNNSQTRIKNNSQSKIKRY